jgi:DNA-binding MarR family transcriptional regulator
MTTRTPDPFEPSTSGGALTVEQAAECLMHHLPALFRQLWADARHELAETHGMTETQLGIVHTLRHHDYTVGEVAGRMKLHTPTVSRISESLVEQGYADRLADAGDRRKVRLTLTDTGHELARTVHGHFHTVVARRLETLSSEDVACIVGACSAFEKLLASDGRHEQKRHHHTEE